MGDNITSPHADRVTARNAEAAEAAVTHLLDRGRRRIALVGADRTNTSGNFVLRLAGYLRAHERAGVRVDDRLMVKAASGHSAAGVAAVDALVESGLGFDALFCLTDTMAFGALYALHRHGLDVPGDVAVMGFDDTEEARYTSPALSSVAQGRDETARTAVELLTRRIEERRTGADPAPFGEYLVDFRLEIREST
jgi:DNA-binding LacI/PurR family transcriptional regulator